MRNLRSNLTLRTTEGLKRPQTNYPFAAGQQRRNPPFDMPLDDLPESDLRPLKRLKRNEKRARKDNPEYARLFLFLLNHRSSRIFPDSVKIVCESKMDSVISVWKLAREIAPVFSESVVRESLSGFPRASLQNETPYVSKRSRPGNGRHRAANSALRLPRS